MRRGVTRRNKDQEPLRVFVVYEAREEGTNPIESASPLPPK